MKSAVLASLLAAALVAVSYGPGLMAGGVLLPLDLLESFPPWVATSDLERPINGLLGDTVQQMYPWRAFAHEEIRAGRMPWLNPYAGAGVPLFANGQSALLFPLNLLTLPLSAELAATVVQLAKPPLAAAGVALFLRALGAGTTAAIFGGLAWAFSGPMVSWLGWPHTNALLVVGYLFWGTARWLQTIRFRWWSTIALATALQLFGGHPETTAHTVFSLGIFVATWLTLSALSGEHPLWRNKEAPPSGRWQGLAHHVAPPAKRALALGAGWVSAIAFGIVLAGVQVAPLLAAIADSLTAADRSSQGLASMVFEPESALTWIVPRFFGSPLAQTISPLNALNYNEAVGYVGLGTLALALVSSRLLLRPGWLPLTATTAVAAGIAYGLPIATELRHLPGLGHAANTRFLFLLAFGLACLGGLGLDACLRSHGRLLGVTAVALLMVIATVVFGLAAAPNLVMPTPADSEPLTPLVATLLRQGELRRTAIVAVAWAILLAATTLALSVRTLPEGDATPGRRWALGARARRFAGTSAAVLPLLAVMGDLFKFGAGYNPTIRPDLLRAPPPAVQAILRADDAPRIAGLGEALLPNTATLYHLSDLRVYEPVAHRRLHPFFEQVDWAVREDIRSRFYLFIWHPDLDLLALAGVRWLLAQPDDPRMLTSEDMERSGLKLRYVDRATAVWEIPAARPRAYLAERIALASGAGDALRMLPLAASSPRGVVIETGGSLRPGLREARGASIVSSRWLPGRAELEVIAPSGGVLVINDARYPGWTARIDGHAADLLPANYLFMAVPLTPGTRHVVLEYQPPLLTLGAGLSLASLLALLAASWPPTRRAIALAARRVRTVPSRPLMIS